MEGWIKLHRKIFDWEWYDDPYVKAVFLEFVLTASLEDKRWKGVLIKRGQLIVGRKSLSKKLGISEQSIRTSITRLKSTNEITSKSTNKFTVITVLNYDKYQSVSTKSTTKSTSNLTNNQPATNHILRSKEVKNIKKEKKRERYTHPNQALLKDKDFRAIAQRWDCPLAFVRTKYDDMVSWYEQDPYKNRKVDWKATLSAWVKKDSLKIKQDYAKQTSEVAL